MAREAGGTSLPGRFGPALGLHVITDAFGDIPKRAGGIQRQLNGVRLIVGRMVDRDIARAILHSGLDIAGRSTSDRAAPTGQLFLRHAESFEQLNKRQLTHRSRLLDDEVCRNLLFNDFLNGVHAVLFSIIITDENVHMRPVHAPDNAGNQIGVDRCLA